MSDLARLLAHLQQLEDQARQCAVAADNRRQHARTEANERMSLKAYARYQGMATAYANAAYLIRSYG